MNKDSGYDIILMNVATNPAKRKIKKSMTKPIWLHLLTRNTVKMKKNDGYARVA